MAMQAAGEAPKSSGPLKNKVMQSSLTLYKIDQK